MGLLAEASFANAITPPAWERAGIPACLFACNVLQAGMPALRGADDTARTSTVDRIPDPAGLNLDAVWSDEWEKNLLEAAAERVKRQVDPEQYQLFDFHVLKQWPAKKVARKLGVSLGKVYFAKYKISKLMKKEVKKLERQLV